MSQGFAQPQPQKASRCNNTANISEVSEQLQGYFSEIEDPRIERSRAHELMDILMISILALTTNEQTQAEFRTCLQVSFVQKFYEN